MPNTSIQLVKANNPDIPVISRLAELIWHHHYPEIISMEQIAYMLDLMYSHESLLHQMKEEGHEFYLIRKNGRDVGFISIRSIDDKGAFYLHKFYLLQDLSGKGNGTAAFNELLKMVLPAQITLAVNRKNFKSVNFYFKNGFKIESVADFDIGNGFFMNDFLMVWRTK